MRARTGKGRSTASRPVDLDDDALLDSWKSRRLATSKTLPIPGAAWLDRAAARAPARKLVTIEDVGFATVGLATDAARLITGDTIHIDASYHIIA
jgi:hypothetical protein